MISKSTTIIKNHFYNYEPPELGTSEAPVHATDTIIKRFRINYSYEEKYRLGIMTPQEYAAWQMELFLKQQEEEESARRSADEQAAAESLEGGTFWANDTSVRVNMSGDDYSKFLAENGLDVSNNNSVDVGMLIQQENDRVIDSIGFMTPQGSIDGILQSADQERAQEEAVSMAASGDNTDPNRVLSEEEIAALFAAMAAG